VGPGGGQLAKSSIQSARFYVGLARGFMDTCPHEKGKAKAVEKVGGGLNTRPVGHHLVSYHLSHVGGAAPRPSE
jgi:hypothetical protein